MRLVYGNACATIMDEKKAKAILFSIVALFKDLGVHSWPDLGLFETADIAQYFDDNPDTYITKRDIKAIGFILEYSQLHPDPTEYISIHDITRDLKSPKAMEAIENPKTGVLVTPKEEETAKGGEAIFGSHSVSKEKTIPEEDKIDIVLLLMDPTTRRFELIQLEFDIKKTNICDILQKIPMYSTEESLRNQKFSCVCNTEGVAYDHNKSLSDYVDGASSIVLAFPETHSDGAQKAAKMAKPILRNPKVEEMLEGVGISLKLDDKEDSKVGNNKGEDPILGKTIEIQSDEV